MIDFLKIRIVVRRGLVWGLAGIAAACSSTDSTGIPSIVTTNPFATVRLNVRAAVMSTVAPYDTLQLVPTAYTVDGTAITLPGPITYTVNDTTLSVSATGLVTVKHKTGTNSYVVAKVQDTTENVTKADTVFILGTTTVPTAPLASYSIQPVGTDSAIVDVNGGAKTLTVTALDANHMAIPAASLVSHFFSSNTTVATIVARSGAVTGTYPGTVLIVATTTYYGVTKSDSLRLTVGYPDVNVILEQYTTLVDGTVQYSFNPATWIVGVHKAIIFESELTGSLVAGLGSVLGTIANTPVSIAFDDPSAAQMSPVPASTLAKKFASNGSGNVNITIPDSLLAKDSVVVDQFNRTYHYYPLATSSCTSTPYPCATARSFATPGTYHYHDTQTGATGTITVMAP